MDRYSSLVEEKCAVKILDIERMFSRRNKVYLLKALTEGDVPIKYAVKVCSQSRAQEESSILYKLRSSGIRVPAVKWSDQRIIVMEYIEGMVIADLMDKEGLILQGKWVEYLVDWLCRLHSIQNIEGKVFCVPDYNIRNFIYTGQEIVGVDFEESVWECPERDLGGLSAFILMSNPMFSDEKYEVVHRLLNTYEELRKIDREMIRKYFFAEMWAASERRKQQKKYLLDKIAEVKNMNFLA